MKRSFPFLPKDVDDLRAIQALCKGMASEAQQIRAFRCIVADLAGTYDRSFDDDNPHVTSFNEGRRHVGRAIVAAAAATAMPGILERKKTNG